MIDINQVLYFLINFSLSAFVLISFVSFCLIIYFTPISLSLCFLLSKYKEEIFSRIKLILKKLFQHSVFSCLCLFALFQHHKHSYVFIMDMINNIFTEIDKMGYLLLTPYLFSLVFVYIVKNNKFRSKL